ncbi:hypothetical protein [Pseudomonas entomophila]|uniref:hypothetical protein n=1 Tax=Pseudomonas entomophila TaxID=312306 RepID=UPI003EBE7710
MIVSGLNAPIVVPWQFVVISATGQKAGCTQATNPMQQHERGATIFHVTVAPGHAFQIKATFLLLFGARSLVFRILRTLFGPFPIVPTGIGRVAPSI